MIDQITPSIAIPDIATPKASEAPKTDGPAFAEELAGSLNANASQADESKKQGGCCGGGQNKGEGKGKDLAPET